MPSPYGEVILDHFRNPRNYGSLQSPDIACEEFNALCGDRIRIEIALSDGTIRDIRFKGDGCAISVAAASVLTEMVIGSSLAAAESLSNETILSSLQSDIKPSRIKCALLALEAMRGGIRAYRLAGD